MLLLAKVSAEPEEVRPAVVADSVEEVLVARDLVQITISDDEAFLVLAERALGDLRTVGPVDGREAAAGGSVQRCALEVHGFDGLVGDDGVAVEGEGAAFDRVSLGQDFGAWAKVSQSWLPA
jgi:hypothetical protein